MTTLYTSAMQSAFVCSGHVEFEGERESGRVRARVDMMSSASKSIASSWPESDAFLCRVTIFQACANAPCSVDDVRMPLLAARAAVWRVPRARAARAVLSQHLITSSRPKTVESICKSAESSPVCPRATLSHLSTSFLSSSRSFHTTATTMASLESITQSLSKLSISPAATVSHGPTNSPQSWREALEASSDAPKPFELIKTLVYKPKTAKTATPVPVFVIARETTDVPSGVLGKTLNLKDLRLASEDLLKEFFDLDKNSLSSEAPILWGTSVIP
ncbi:hypothetical protein C8Q73DRAFT_255469 [Cubamyces lactineus]|nr:hypothetical protein C8Q73DRAFT_255469 [Cubamyces lactineus]